MSTCASRSSSHVSSYSFCKVFEVIIVLTNIYSLLSNYLNAFISGVLSKYSALSHYIISSPWLSAFCSLRPHTILGPQRPPPPEYAVKLCFPLLEVPVPRLSYSAV